MYTYTSCKHVYSLRKYRTGPTEQSDTGGLHAVLVAKGHIARSVTEHKPGQATGREDRPYVHVADR